MDKREYFLKALRGDAYRRKHWILSVFTQTREAKPEDGIYYGYELAVNHEDPKDLTVSFYDPETNSLVPIEGLKRGSQHYNVDERLEINPGEMVNVKTKVDTRYGNALINAIILVYPFGDKLDFLTGRIDGGKLEEILARRLIDNPEEGKPVPHDKISVAELQKYCEAMSSLAGISQICVPAASPKALTVDPGVLKRRDELLEEYKDQLHDPAIIARIEKELVDLDKASFKGDPAEGFFIKAKNWDVTRKRSFIMVGVESGFGDTTRGVAPIKTSLREKWDVKNLPPMIDSLRAGSFNRGSQTALGGQAVKDFYRIFQNSVVAEPDCGTVRGMNWLITDENYKRFVGLYPLGKADVKPFDEETLKGLIGREIIIRSPMFCRTVAPSYCAKCVGDLLAMAPTGLPSAVSDIGSVFLNMFMKKMHGSALRTARYKPLESIT